MKPLRLAYSSLSPEAYQGLLSVKKALEKSSLGSNLIELVYLRVSQINGCSFCLEMHSKSLRDGGEKQSRLDAVAGWHVSTHLLSASALLCSGRSLWQMLPIPMHRTVIMKV